MSRLDSKQRWSLVIGGSLLTGGYGSVVGASFGALIFGVVQIGITYTNIDSDWFRVFLGAMLLSILTDGFDILGINANSLDIIFGGAILVAMIANVQLGRLREAGRT